jgi:ubiquinone/menaquinone biosynthesis C-methylase UbiE/uncharacterized protein YbaR (Trm112 family)
MMESNSLGYLCCPYDRKTLVQLKLQTALETELQCYACGRSFPIKAGIARFLTEEENQLCALQKSEMEVRDRQYRAPFSSRLSTWDAPELDAVRAALGDSRGLSVLDAGCGVGRSSRAIQNAEHVSAIDFSWEGLIHFQRPPRVSVGLVQGDITRMPIRDHVFDVALSCQVLSHLPTPDLRTQFLSELVRVLKPGGRLILTAMHYSFRYRRRQIPQEAVEDGSYYYRFEADELRRLLSESFTILSLHGFWIYLPKTYWLFTALRGWRVYWDRIWRSLPLSLTYGKFFLAVCSPKP